MADIFNPQPPRRVLINCDMGEAYGNWKMGPDEDLMPLIDIANVACGFHAGDPQVMHRTIKLAKKYNKLVGAHPSLPDREGYGRRFMDISDSDLYDQVVYQIGAISGMLRAEGMQMSHVKPHGMLYRMSFENEKYAEPVMRAIKVFDMPVIGIAGSWHEVYAKKYDLKFMAEFYPDLKYDDNGRTCPINSAGRVSMNEITAKVRKVIEEDKVMSVDGNLAKVGLEGRPFTCCIHSDLPGSLESLKEVRAAL